MTAESIVQSARRRLGDTNKTGWSDPHLVDLVDKGQKDITKLAGIYKRTLYVSVSNNIVLIPLPLDTFQINRAEYEGVLMHIITREDAENKVTPPARHIIRNDLGMNLFELSEPFTELPVHATAIQGFIQEQDLDTTITVETPQLGVFASTEALDTATMLPTTSTGVVESISVPITWDVASYEEGIINYGDLCGIESENLYTSLEVSPGVVTGIDLYHYVNGTYGFLSRVDYSNAVGEYGAYTDVLTESQYIKLYVSAAPPKISSIHDATIISDLWERALVHYVVGMARQDDNDEGNYQLGELELKKYDKEVAKAKKLSAKSYTSQVSEEKETQYRRI